MEDQIAQLLKNAAKKLGASSDITVELTRQTAGKGDLATNLAMKLSGQLSKKPTDIAQQLVAELEESPLVTSTEIAGPGFINVCVADDLLQHAINDINDKREQFGRSQDLKGQVVVAEYSDPNPFKVLHAGHLYTSLVGDSIANLLEATGASVKRLNYGGDVGLHVAKTLWAMTETLGGELPEKLAKIKTTERAEWLADCYVKGNVAYDTNAPAKKQIDELNKKVYQLQATGDKQSNLAKLYWTGRQWSYDYFEQFYKRLGVKFDKFIAESETADLGTKTVKKHLGSVFKESEGAIIFDGEAHGLHTRVFINAQGLPTYEAKDVGLILKKKQDYNFDRSVVITANEQEQYMAVVLKAVEQFEPHLAKATTHLTHGIVRLAGGVKMSSRLGNFLRATDVLDAAQTANQKLNQQTDENISLGAVRYAFLKHRLGADIIYDPDESVALQGNSGPYLQYAHARACSILRQKGDNWLFDYQLNSSERTLVLKLSDFPNVVKKAADELAPHHVCNYLYELAQEFNRFYENNRVIGGEREINRLSLVSCYITVLQNGLKLLGIDAPEKM